MMRLSFRKVFPKGLYARSALLSLVPVLIVLAAMSVYYFYGHLRSVNTKLSQGIARQISLIQENCALDGTNRSAHLSIKTKLSIIYDCDYRDTSETELIPADFFHSDIMTTQLDTLLGVSTNLYLMEGGRRLDIRIPSAGGVLRVIIDRKRAIEINGHIFIVWVAVAALLMILTALAFLQNHVRSILRLTEAAQAFGRGQDVEGFHPSGATEVRAAASAVIEMRQRLTAFAEKRTMMLAGVSHDLRTVLARLQLHLALQEQSSDVLAARDDVRDMEAMLEEYLAFAQGEDMENAERLNLKELVETVAAKFPKARFIDETGYEWWLKARPVALKRAVANLLANASAFGDTVEVHLKSGKDELCIIVDDDGPGIPPEKYEEAFRPFSRLNLARTQNMPGVGLGLALTRDMARSHGGSVTLDLSPLGGLRAQMSFPV